jgi:hypothetical protein
LRTSLLGLKVIALQSDAEPIIPADALKRAAEFKR